MFGYIIIRLHGFSFTGCSDIKYVRRLQSIHGSLDR